MYLQRIPKAIVKIWQIPEEGCVLLTMDEYGINHQAAYYTSTDGRMEFVSGWAEFAKQNGLTVGATLLFLFEMNARGSLTISVDIL